MSRGRTEILGSEVILHSSGGYVPLSVNFHHRELTPTEMLDLGSNRVPMNLRLP